MNLYTLTKKKEGFTLLETLVAVAILLTAIVGTLSMVTQSLTAAFVAKDQVIALYLAFEGVEYIKNLRDNNNLVTPAVSWLSGDIAKCVGGNGCIIDMSKNPPEVQSCSGTCASLKYDSAKNFYTYDAGGDDTTFIRTVLVNETLIGVEAEIVVTVSWKTGNLDRDFTIRESMFNWQRQFNF